MGDNGIRSSNLGDMNVSQKSKNIPKVYARIVCKGINVRSFPGESFHQILKRLHNPKKV